ncbi:Glycosyl hydrolase family 81 [Lignipirellula cremea]|uniref:glucan endo-1,3-beta-D-glucosidase n=2 Tax=Lignipirellula cremea TaxID=2528010 RepID=A0A518DYK5_9BACT|nr:Glycosyl hydrolase family 81 [Lignipirellula cremea]
MMIAGMADSRAQTIAIGKGAYRTDLPPDAAGKPRLRVDAAPLVSGAIEGAVPTSDWWSSLVWPVHSQHSLPMFPHPLGVQAHPQGLGLGYTPTPSISSSEKDGAVFQSGTSYKFPYRQSLLVGLQGGESKAAVLDRYSDWSVTALWQNDQDQLRATFAHGSPFVYFERESEKPIEVAFSAAPVDRNAEPVQPLVFRWTKITAPHTGKPGEIRLSVDAGKHIGVGSRARLVYDFDGDGNTDRVETFALFATDPRADSFESYSSANQKLDDRLTRGEMQAFRGGSVSLEFWKCFGEGELSLQLSKSAVRLPFAGEESTAFLKQSGEFGKQPDEAIVTLKEPDHPPGAAKVFYDEGAVVGVTLNGAHYGIFAPSGSQWSGVTAGRAASLTSDLAGKDYLSVVVLPDDKRETLEWFRRRAYAFVIDTRVAWKYEPSQAAVVTTYTVTTEAKEGDNRETAMALYRHQYLHLNETVQLTAFRYASPRGEMQLLSGDHFSTTIPFLGVLPALPNPTSGHAELKQRVDADIQQILTREKTFEREDSYWNGKEFGKWAELIQIADQLGKTEARDQLLSLLQDRVEDWLDGRDQLFFYYDKSWGALIGYPDSYGSADQFNDHHFHYSYFIKAAATIAQFDPAWAAPENYGGMLELLIRNCANQDRQDNRFPWMRNLDPYAGHSWASGHAGFASGNNQESSSESMNFATALILYGQATQNDKIRDLGIYWHSTEAEAIRQYWFDVDRKVFPPGYGHTCVGMVWGDGGTYGTWWTANPEEIHGINYLPINGGSLYLGRDPAYVQENFANMLTSNRRFHNGGFEGDPEKVDRWHDILYEYLALANAEKAIEQYEQHGQDLPPEFGETRAHTFQWLHALRELGRFDDTIRADHPTAVVFTQDGKKHYLIYHPQATPQTVTFTDGVSYVAKTGWNRFASPE